MSLQTVGSQPKYGLIKRQNAAGNSAKLKKTQIFQMDEEDDDEMEKPNDYKKTMNKEISRRTSTTNTISTDKTAIDALSEDPNVFDYDGAYDSFKLEEKSRVGSLVQSSHQTAPKARYVENLLVAAKIRERERDKVYERKLLKERLEEDKVLGISSEEATKFITTAYKQKLVEDQKWQYEEKLMEEIEKRTNVDNKGMHGFYANLLTKNISMGGNVAENAVSSFTAGSSRQKQVVVTQARSEEVVSHVELKEEPTQANVAMGSTEEKRSEKAKDSHESETKHADMHAAARVVVPSNRDDKKHEQSKDSAIIAAKERYLARKRSAAAADIE